MSHLSNQTFSTKPLAVLCCINLCRRVTTLTLMLSVFSPVFLGTVLWISYTVKDGNSQAAILV